MPPLGSSVRSGKVCTRCFALFITSCSTIAWARIGSEHGRVPVTIVQSFALNEEHTPFVYHGPWENMCALHAHMHARSHARMLTCTHTLALTCTHTLTLAHVHPRASSGSSDRNLHAQTHPHLHGHCVIGTFSEGDGASSSGSSSSSSNSESPINRGGLG